MSYFPNYFPPENWWIGKIFLHQAVDLTLRYRPVFHPETSKYVFREVQIPAARALNALFRQDLYEKMDTLSAQVPASLLERIKAISPGFETWEAMSAEIQRLLTDLKAVFRFRFMEMRTEEYFYYLGEDIQNELDDPPDPDNPLPEEKIREDRISGIIDWMRQDHDSLYWNGSECGVVAGFGGYGEWKEYAKIVSLEMDVIPPPPTPLPRFRRQDSPAG